MKENSYIYGIFCMIMRQTGNDRKIRYIYTCLKMRKSIDKKRLACIIRKVLFVGNKQLYIFKVQWAKGSVGTFFCLYKNNLAQ